MDGAEDFVEIEIGDLDESQVRRVVYLLRGIEVDLDAERCCLVVPAARQIEALNVIEEAAVHEPLSRDLRSRARDRLPDGPALADRSRRVGAGVIDWLLIGVTTFVLGGICDSIGLPAPGWIAYLVAQWSIVVVPMTVSGRPPGAVLVGTVVVDSRSLRVPEFIACVIRWLVAQLPTLVVGAVLAIGAHASAGWFLWSVQTVAVVAIYLGVFTHPQRQGLHDRAAETFVVRSPGVRTREAREVGDDRASERSA